MPDVVSIGLGGGSKVAINQNTDVSVICCSYSVPRQLLCCYDLLLCVKGLSISIDTS